MTAHAPVRPLEAADLIIAVRQLAATAEAEIEAAYRFRDGAPVREWHLERADQATVELLGLINGPLHRAEWDRLMQSAAPLMTLPPDLPQVLCAVQAGGLT